MQNGADTNNKNIIVGPDYGQMIRSQTNGAIVEAFISILFSKNTKFNFRTVLSMVRNMIILMAVKTMLEDSKTYLDKFKFSNLNPLKYFYQRIRYSEIKFDIMLVCGKWMYHNYYISINTLSPFLEQKSIYYSQSATYYYNMMSYLVKVEINQQKISFCVPNINSIVRHIEDDVIHKNKEIMHGGNTTMSKVTFTPSNVLNLEPVQQSHAFATENYINLKNSIESYFLIDKALKLPYIPFCINFDGERGTGKTTFGNYIAESGYFDRIIICNLVNVVSSFSELVQSLETKIKTCAPKEKKANGDCEYILIIFDEIDKWLESYKLAQIHKLREEARNKKQITNEKTQAVTIVETHPLSEKEELEKMSQIRNEFLDQLYKIVDGHTLSDVRKYVIIFNTNDFERLFADSDPRYLALRDRFQRYQFKKIKKNEVISYLKAISNKLNEYFLDSKIVKNTVSASASPLYIYDEKIFDQIPDNLEISYRTLYKILKNYCFNIVKTVDLLSTNKGVEKFLNLTNETSDQSDKIVKPQLNQIKIEQAPLTQIKIE